MVVPFATKLKNNNSNKNTMKKSLCFILLSALVVLASCKKEEPKPTPERPDADMTVVLSPNDYKILSGLKAGSTINFDLENFNGTPAWILSNPYTISLEENGHATCLCYGVVTITVIDDDGNSANCIVKVVETPRNYKLVWEDNFEGNTLNTNYWTAAKQNGGGNAEVNAYLPANVTVSNGCLHLIAKKEQCIEYPTKKYTSGMVTTKDKVKVKYGKVEARINLPKGVGNWPAFWMLSNDNKYGAWPNSGEIDIMEHVGKDVTMHSMACHTKSKNGGNSWQYIDRTCETLEGDFHTYTLEWVEKYHSGADALIFYRDGKRMIIKTQQQNVEESTWQDWPFKEDFYIILNLALGGSWGGSVIDDTAMPMDMQIDWVKVYEIVK